MPAATTIIAAAGLALAAGSTFLSVQQQKKAAKKQQKLADLENRREKRRQIRQRLSEQGRQENLGAGITGQTGSLSGIQGGITSSASLAGGEVGFVNQSGALNKQINRHLGKASFFQGLAGFSQSASGAIGSVVGGINFKGQPDPLGSSAGGGFRNSAGVTRNPHGAGGF